MALVKVVRKEPEVKGGATVAMVAEEALESVLQNGWELAGKEPNKEPVKDEGKKEPAVEVQKEDVKKEEPVKKTKKAL